MNHPNSLPTNTKEMFSALHSFVTAKQDLPRSAYASCSHTATSITRLCRLPIYASARAGCGEWSSLFTGGHSPLDTKILVLHEIVYRCTPHSLALYDCLICLSQWGKTTVVYGACVYYAGLKKSLNEKVGEWFLEDLQFQVPCRVPSIKLAIVEGNCGQNPKQSLTHTRCLSTGS